MKRRWVFYFEEGNVITDFDNEGDDSRLQDILENTQEGFIAFPAGKLSVYANLNLVKCITREELEDVPVVDEIPVVIPDLIE